MDGTRPCLALGGPGCPNHSAYNKHMLVNALHKKVSVRRGNRWIAILSAWMERGTVEPARRSLARPGVAI
jgi:hypothetical protein